MPADERTPQTSHRSSPPGRTAPVSGARGVRLVDVPIDKNARGTGVSPWRIGARRQRRWSSSSTLRCEPCDLGRTPGTERLPLGRGQPAIGVDEVVPRRSQWEGTTNVRGSSVVLDEPRSEVEKPGRASSTSTSAAGASRRRAAAAARPAPPRPTTTMRRELTTRAATSPAGRRTPVPRPGSRR